MSRDVVASSREQPERDGTGLRVAVVCGRFNDHVTVRLLDGVRRGLRDCKVARRRRHRSVGARVVRATGDGEGVRRCPVRSTPSSASAASSGATPRTSNSSPASARAASSKSRSTPACPSCSASSPRRTSTRRCAGPNPPAATTSARKPPRPRSRWPGCSQPSRNCVREPHDVWLMHAETQGTDGRMTRC